jgi:hypothetical protein
MQIKEQVGSVRDQYSSITTDSIGLKTINFTKEPWNMDHCSIANNTQCSLMKNTGWNKMKGKLLDFRVVDGVSSICSTLFI